MEIFLFILVILFILAISDLVVGVGNDAVNFLNSAIGAKVAPRHVIMIVASIGIIIGTLFSGGMMEVARKGIFNPQFFYFEELMTIFLAVMLTDVILLDFFNTYGLPTSTTVSIVFELLGSAVAISLIKISSGGEDLGKLVDYINTSKAIAIISGILLSIVVAFSTGAIVQFLARLVFTFDYAKKIKRYGGIFAGVCFTAITFFILIKGSKSAAFMTADFKEWISGNTGLIIVASFIFWTLLFQLLVLFKVKVLRIIVLVGTFALALAFAANDLVNFIGVPLAGLHSYQIAVAEGDIAILMSKLQGKVQSEPLLLIFAGLIMIATLYFNKKARSVVKTSLDLGRQQEGDERFESSMLARTLVRMGVSLSNGVNKVVPSPILKSINSRFSDSDMTPVSHKGEKLSFDLIRASVNLMVASVLISLATSWKLPLSTTYVTFMVAMGTSLSDKAWGRDSAVYRINGVITVVGGWFFTAFSAFTVAGVFASIIYFGELAAIILLSILAIYFVYRSHRLHDKNTKREESVEEDGNVEQSDVAESALNKIVAKYSDFMNYLSTSITSTFSAFIGFERNAIKECKADNKKIKKLSNKLVNNIIFAVKNLPENEVKRGRRYGKMMGATNEISMNYRSLVNLLYTHIDNNHKPLSEDLNNRITQIKGALVVQINSAEAYLNDHSKYDEFVQATEELNNLLTEMDENHVLSLRTESEYSSRGNMLYLDIVSAIENISGQIDNLITVLHKNILSIKDINTDTDSDTNTDSE